MDAAIDPVTGLPIGPPVDTRPAKRPGRVTLEGRDVTLMPLDPAAHGGALYAAAAGPGTEYLWQYLFEPPCADRAAFDAMLDAKARSADPFYLAIVDRASGRAVGYAAYLRIEPAHRVIEVGSILFTPPLQRTRGATEAMYLMARHTFEDLGYRRYEWKCHALNEPSRRAAVRLGFTFEGVFRQHLIVKGRSRDTAWYAMIDAEWPGRRARFERWLAPENFDAGGRQKTSLSGDPHGAIADILNT